MDGGFVDAGHNIPIGVKKLRAHEPHDLFLTAFLQPQTFGGYYTPDRDEKDVPVGGIRTGLGDIPRYLTHIPALDVAQFGATVRRVADSRLKKSDVAPQGVTAGVMAGIFGLLDEVPFVNEMTQLDKAMDSRTRGDFFEEFAKSKLIPAASSQAAEFTDKNAKGDTIKRNPQGIIESLMTGIPGLRKYVAPKGDTLASRRLTPQTYLESDKFKKAPLSSVIKQFVTEQAAGYPTDDLTQGLRDKADAAIEKGKFSQEQADRVNELLSLKGDDAYKASEENLAKDEPDETFANDETFIHHIMTVAQALGTDPLDVMKKWYHGETIRKLRNGAIIVQRMPMDSSEAFKKKLGASKDQYLDHTDPLELGGMNTEDNLKLVPREVWASYTPIENALGSALEAGKINKYQALRLVEDFKSGAITRKQVADELGVSEESLRPKGIPSPGAGPRRPKGLSIPRLKLK